ncbi:sel1 repeat family protein [Alphaproteobacteria bacterium]|nr:sel1 repeat family protein [Alphaproteobacteria bacterium]
MRTLLSIFLFFCLGIFSSYAASSAMDVDLEGADAASSTVQSSSVHLSLPHPDHLLLNETSFGQWISLAAQESLEGRGLTETGYNRLAGEMQGGGDLSRFSLLCPYGDVFNGMVRRPQGLESADLDPALLPLLQSVPESHSVQILGYPLFWKPAPTLSYVVVHRESTERDTEVSLEEMTEIFHRDQIALLMQALRSIGAPGDPSGLINSLNRFTKTGLADYLPYYGQRPGFPTAFIREALYMENKINAVAQLKLGMFYSAQNNLPMARDYLKRAADQGMAVGQFNFAILCNKGQGGAVDLPRARDYFNRAADQGLPVGQVGVATMCLKGLGRAVDLPRARNYYQLAADQGHALAQAAFANMCAQAQWGAVDLPMARDYSQRAADQGVAVAQAGFASMCAKGQGGAVDLPRARDYYQRAADQGMAVGQVLFANLCLKGRGGAVDLPRARDYFKRAADQGHAAAQQALRDLDAAESSASKKEKNANDTATMIRKKTWMLKERAH